MKPNIDIMLKKQNYVEPLVEVLEVQGEAIVCTSGGLFGAPYYEEEGA